MRIAITGATGLIGAALSDSLQNSGHHVTRLSRRPSSEPDFSVWDPDTGVAEGIEDAEAIVHLAGENIAGGRWTPGRKQRILDSRVSGTKRLCESLAALPSPPPTLITASAVGFYGDRGSAIIDESSPAGQGFLPEVCQAWEAATAPAQDRGIRTVHLRIGIVLTPNGGALQKMLLPFKLGAGGVLGSGSQYMPWIAIDDVLNATLHVLTSNQVTGPVNAVAPGVVTNRDFTKILGRVLRRPTLIPTPAFAMRLAFGEMADALLLGGARVIPTRLGESGFEFGYPALENALRHVLEHAT